MANLGETFKRWITEPDVDEQRFEDDGGHAAETDDERASESPSRASDDQERPSPSDAPVEPGPFVGPVLARGVEAPERVRALHQLIGSIYPASLDGDGVYGELTELAVRDLQDQLGARVDGVVGPVTWRVLRRSARAAG